MESSRDARRAIVSAANGLPRRRQRITTLRDSIDKDRQVKSQETVRSRDREEKELEREFRKRRRIDRTAAQQRSESTDSNDEECCEEGEEMRIYQHNQFSSTSNNRRGLRAHRSSPVLRGAADEMLGVPVPRRARSASAKRLQELSNSGSGDDSMKKKMKYPERRAPISNPKQSQDDIEIEVAEALFDLMKQSQSQSKSSQRQENVDTDGLIPAGDELKISKADGGKDENNAFSVQNEPPIKANAGADLGDSLEELKREGKVEKERLLDDGFVNKVEVGFPKESESPSSAKANACEIQDATVAKAHYDAIIVETKKETKLEIDLMSSPLLSSPERDGTDPAVMDHAVRKKSEVAGLAFASGMQGEKIGIVNSDQQSNLVVEKHTLQQQAWKEDKNQSPTSLLPSPVGMSSWPGVLPHPGFMLPLQAMPINGIAKSSLIMQPPQYKFSQPRPKRCTTHQSLAQSIHYHQELIKKSLSTGPIALCGSKSPSLKFTSPAHQFSPGNPFLGEFQGGQNLATGSVGNGKDKSSDAAAVALNTTSSKSSHQASASSFLHGHGFLLPFGHRQTTMMAPTNSSGSPQSATSAANATLLSNSAGRLPVNFPFPISTNIPMPPFKGGSHSMPFFNSSLYPSPAFNQQPFTTSHHASSQSASQNMNLSSHRQPQSSAKTSENKLPTSVSANLQSEKPAQPSYSSIMSDAEINWKNGASCAPSFVSHSAKPSSSPQQGSKGRVVYDFSFGSNASATPVLNFSPTVQSSGMFQMLPDMSLSGMQMLHQTSEGKSLASGGQSLNCSRSDHSEISALSTMGPPNFDARNMNFLPSSLDGLPPFQTTSGVPVPNFQQHHNIHGSFHTGILPSSSSSSNRVFDTSSFPKTAAPEIPQLKCSQGQTHITFGNGSFQGHQFVTPRNASSVASATPPPPSQESDGQKSPSPACRRNVPSILSTCPSQLPELKY
ncbi:protein TIME FOR COFFEE-like [Salvia divinorum]|uniref:Protein TIME FOR COFFEE-like n=1 Tax=Salvia divinorum TaxID=28513 RepID=A0ABD1GWT9_SALDI